MKRLDKIKAIDNEFVGVVDVFTLDCQQINFIDVENNIIEFTTSKSSCCNPFNEIEGFSVDLEDFIQTMDQADFIELLDEIDNAC